MSECHDPTCDHSKDKECQKNPHISVDEIVEFCKKNPGVIPAGLLVLVGLVQGSIASILAGAALIAAFHQIDKLKCMCKNCGPWY